jgi:hypothetical protein
VDLPWLQVLFVGNDFLDGHFMLLLTSVGMRIDRVGCGDGGDISTLRRVCCMEGGATLVLALLHGAIGRIAVGEEQQDHPNVHQP